MTKNTGMTTIMQAISLKGLPPKVEIHRQGANESVMIQKTTHPLYVRSEDELAALPTGSWLIAYQGDKELASLNLARVAVLRPTPQEAKDPDMAYARRKVEVHLHELISDRVLYENKDVIEIRLDRISKYEMLVPGHEERVTKILERRRLQAIERSREMVTSTNRDRAKRMIKVVKVYREKRHTEPESSFCRSIRRQLAEIRTERKAWRKAVKNLVLLGDITPEEGQAITTGTSLEAIQEQRESARVAIQTDQKKAANKASKAKTNKAKTKTAAEKTPKATRVKAFKAEI